MPAPFLGLTRPRQRVSADVGEALHRFPDAFLVAEARILDAAERRHLDAVARNLPYIYRANVELADEARDVVEPMCADARREPVGGGIGDADRVVDVLD